MHCECEVDRFAVRCTLYSSFPSYLTLVEFPGHLTVCVIPLRLVRLIYYQEFNFSRREQTTGQIITHHLKTDQFKAEV